MSEELIVRHCSPTLAGLKTGNTFWCAFEDDGTKKRTLRAYNQKLGKKGLRLVPLKKNGKRTLLYLFRPARLKKDLADPTAARLLQSRGYPIGSAEGCVVHLIRRIEGSEGFPHEIGLFLGYPSEDVDGFIENRAAGCKCVGTWKVYGDADAAEKCFARYQKCTRVYCDKLCAGCPFERLAVKGA